MIPRRVPSFMLRKRRAIGLSETIIVIISLTASIILATGIVIFGTSLFQGGAQQESISVTGIKLWVNGIEQEGLAWGAFVVRNTGDKVLSVDKINVRGQDVPFGQWYPDTTVSSTLIQQPMNFTGWSGTGGQLDNSGSADSCATEPTAPFELEVRLAADSGGNSGSVCADSAAGPVGLDPGAAAIIYFKLNNGTLTTADGGSSTSVGIFAGKVGAPQSIPIASKT
ncbi:MAG: hypothetical protein ACE5R3_04110 [Nitrosopumilaceae archaeon]